VECATRIRAPGCSDPSDRTRVRFGHLLRHDWEFASHTGKFRIADASVVS
jgi:hypothetical protein